jgi:hypothetical protein
MLIHNAEVTGSLNINNVPFNSGSFSGSFRGDGSQLSGVTGATTASYVEYSNVGNKPALVSGSSQITYSGISGIPSGIVSGSSQVTYSGLTGIPAGIVSGSDQVTGFGIFATTGSNQFNGSQAITGSLTVIGQVVAQTLNVQQVTSSIVYSSGSNVFGNTLGNTQQFTGSVSVTGSLTSNGALSGTSAAFSSFGRFGGWNIATNFGVNTGANTSIYMNEVDSSTAELSAVNNANNAVRILRLQSPGGGTQIGGTLVVTGSATFASSVTILDSSANDTTLTIGTNGEVPTIKAGGSNTDLKIEAVGSGGFLQLFTNSNPRVHITPAGNVGIGTTSPSSFAGYLNTTLQASGANGVNLDFRTSGGTREGVLILTSGTEFSLISATAIPLTFRTNDTERMRITSDTAAFLRMASGTGGIQFNGDTSAANALDDYEEGTWTPSVGGNATYSSDNYGRYTKIGNVVTCQFRIAITTLGTGSTFQLSGFPFASANILNVQTGHVSYWGDLAVNTIFLSFYIENDATTAQFVGKSSSGVTVDNGISLFGNGTQVVGHIIYRTS